MIRELGDLPPEAERTRTIAKEIGISSMIAIPLRIEGQLRGMLVCVDFYKREADVEEKSRMRPGGMNNNKRPSQSGTAGLFLCINI